MMDLITACADPNLFAPWFRDRATWSSWWVFLKALFALPLDDEELATYTRCTGRVRPSEAQANEAWLTFVAGVAASRSS
jgi:hypothetical protein